MATVVDVSELKESVERWANEGAGQAVDALGQSIRDKAPFGASEGGHDGPRLVDTLEVTITGEGETWSGEIAFTAEHAEYVDGGTSPHLIEGNPLLAFPWQGATVIVHSVQHPGTSRTGFFTDNMTDEAWVEQLTTALDSLGPPA